MSDHNEKRAKDLVARMTLDEKIAQIGSVWVHEIQTDGELDWDKVRHKFKHGIGQITRLAGASTLDPQHAAKAANQLQKFFREETRLGIPVLLHEECCLGAMVLGGTVFPQMIGLASSFEPDLAEQMAAEIRNQLMAIGARLGLGPDLDLGMDPRWGRVEETFGEDPLLVSHFGTAYIKGLQSSDLKHGVMATGKHFVGHSLSQGGLNCAPVHLGMREIFETHLAPFQAAIRDAGLASIMNAYPEIDGDVVGASRRFLTEILRDRLGFKGLVVSDYESLIMLNNFHFIAQDDAEAAVKGLTAGIDVELPTSVCYDAPLKKALEDGRINLDLIDRAVIHHLQMKFELGLFENPYVDEAHPLEVFDTPHQRNLAKEIAVKSIVLLKNDGVLPLAKTIKSIAVIGPNADSERCQIGDYSYWAMSELVQFQAPANHAFIDKQLQAMQPHQTKIVSILNGIRALIVPHTELLYAKGCDHQGEDLSGIEEAVEKAERADAVILVLGDRSGLVPACTTGETRDSFDLLLPGMQEVLAKAILATGTPVILVLVNGRPYAIPWLAENAQAVLEAWLPGEEGGPAVAEIIFGDANPGGKLPITFPRSVGQLPLVYHAKPTGKKSHWYGDYVSGPVTPLFPFGHGLSYTTFEYRNLQITPGKVTAGDVLEISFELENTGEVEGEEVAQLYVHDVFASIPRPTKALKGYQRLALAPGERRKITFQMQVDQCAFYDRDLDLILEPGVIHIMVGSSSEDIRLSGEFEITGRQKMIVSERVFTCPVILE